VPSLRVITENGGANCAPVGGTTGGQTPVQAALHCDTFGVLLSASNVYTVIPLGETKPDEPFSVAVLSADRLAGGVAT
jgi:hypothetical protein